MGKKKKVLLKPSSKLGYNDKMRICYNCVFRYKDDSGYCPMEMQPVDYNHQGCKFFRYNFEIMNKYYQNKEEWEKMTLYLKIQEIKR